ncbi:MAG: hypothetical protein HKO93_06985, partial [Flavobacteriales bacterium]|nr:hypothetical protein [Flavobacteriales bacterium]
MEFIENLDQWHSNVLFRTAAGGGSVFLENDGISYSFFDASQSKDLHELQFADKETQDAYSINGHAWKMILLNSLEANISGESEREHYFNYFIGNDPSKWASRVPAYGMVRYEGIYEGIDMLIYSSEGNFKYDFIISAGNNPDQIKMNYEGLDFMSVEEGNLILGTSIGEFSEKHPFAYQLVNGAKVEVQCEFKLEGSQISFEFPEGYDSSKELVIDPELIAATLSGTTGFQSNYGHCAAYDIEGNIYTGCVAGGADYPATPGSFTQSYGGGVWDIGISKLTPDGSDLLWATFLGGENSDYPHSMIANDAQELYVYGSTSSDDYPTTPAAYQTSFGGLNDIIITHLEADGSALVGSTFIGGSDSDGRNVNSINYGDAYRGEIFLDYDNDPIICSSSASSDFPTLFNAYQSVPEGEQDAVLLKMNPTLTSLSISTFIGGPEGDVGFGVRTSTDGSIYICGGAGDGFPVTSDAYQTAFLGGGGFGGEFDGFICKFDSEGSNLLASTYFGTDETDQAFFIDLDFDENVWIYGQGGADIPVSDGVYSDEGGGLFVSKFTPDLDELLVSTT